jgi:hypothetical protein
MPAIQPSAAPRARDRQRRAAGAAQPLQPADGAGDDEEQLQRHVGIQVDAVEQRGKHPQPTMPSHHECTLLRPEARWKPS